MIPETNNRGDWPRLVKIAFENLKRRIDGHDATLTALDGRLTTAETTVADHETRIGTAETDITALQAATNWAALVDYADDTAAAAGGVAIGSLYRTGSTIKTRVS